MKIPHVGGASTHILGIKEYLERTERPVRLIAQKSKEDIRSGGTRRFSPFMYWIISLLKIGYTFIFYPKAEGEYNFFHDWFSVLGVRKAPKTRLILYVHGELVNELLALGTIQRNSLWESIFKWNEKRALIRADIVICVDQRLTDYVFTNYGIHALCRPNFVEIPVDLRQPSAPDNEIQIVISRRFVEKNGIQYALEAIQIVHNEIGNQKKIQCDLFGSGQLYQMLKDKYQSEVIHFHGDVSTSTVREYLRKAHFCLVPSIPVGDYVEATSISALEAAAEGCLLIASDIGGLQDLFNGNDGAWLVSPKNSKEIAEAIIKFSQDSKAYVSIANRGQQKVVNSYSSSVYVEQFLLKI